MLVAGKVTTDQNIIRAWIEKRQGWPALVRTSSDSGFEYRLFIGFADTLPDPHILPISWEAFFARFEKDRLSFMYEEIEANGDEARFYFFL